MITSQIVHAHVFEGVVQHGDKRGRTLGYPTINLEGEAASESDRDSGRCDIGDGVWAGIVEIGQRSERTRRAAAISVGRRETYYGLSGIRLVEAYLLDFTGEVYGEPVRIECSAFLRPQAEFNSSEALVAQLDADVAAVREWVAQIAGSHTPIRPAGQKGWGPTHRKSRRDRTAAHAQREIRRNELVADAVRQCGGDSVSHEHISEVTHLPVGYLEHRYPTIADLHSAG